VKQDVIVVIGHSRAELLENCIESIRRAENNEQFYKVLICQRGHEDVRNVCESYRLHFDLVIEVERIGEAAASISKNRYLAYQIAFDHLQGEFAIVLEDDVEISSDALVFAKFVFGTYQSQRRFRAVNFASGNPFKPEDAYTYSKVRYALTGPASLLPRKSWEALRKRDLMNKAELEIFDGTFETFIQTGFVIMPNSARYLDHGRIGTHASSVSDKTYFEKLEKSFIFDAIAPSRGYENRYVYQHWRSDCIKYMRWMDLYYFIRDLVVANREIKALGAVLKLFRRIKKSISD